MPARNDTLAEFLRRTAEGDEGSFTSLYDASSRAVFGLTIKILGDWDAAEEATLEAYTTVWRQASQYDPARGAAMSWILTVARSKAIDLLRSRMRRRERERSLKAADGLRDLKPGPELLSSRSEEIHKMKEALASLPQEQREVIETAYFSELSHSEVAAALGQPLGTVKTRIRSGLTTLRRVLAEAL